MSEVQDRLLEGLQDFVQFLRERRHEHNDHARRIILTNRLAHINNVLLEYEADFGVDMHDKEVTLTQCLRLLEECRTKIPSTPEFSIILLEIHNLIQYVVLLISSLYLFDESKKIASSAKMLSSILMDLQDAPQLPEIPPVSSPDFRKISTLVYNHIVTGIGIYETALDNLPVINSDDLVSWMNSIFEGYRKLIGIASSFDSEEVLNMYAKLGKVEVYLSNRIGLMYAYENLGEDLRYLISIYPESFPSSINLNGLVQGEGINAYLQYLDWFSETLHQVDNEVRTWIGKRVDVKQEDLLIFDEMRLLMQLTQIRRNALNYLMATDRNPDDLAQIMLEWYDLLQLIRGNSPLTKEFLETQNGSLYLQALTEFLPLLAEEAYISPYFVFAERRKGLDEVFDNLPSEEYASVHQMKILVNLCGDLHHGQFEALGRYYQELMFLRSKLELNVFLFVQNTLVQIFLGYYLRFLEFEKIEALLEDTLEMLDDSGVSDEYALSFKTYTEMIKTAMPTGNDANFSMLKNRVTLNPLDPMTFLVPSFSGIAMQNNLPEIPYVPFNLFKDKVVNVERN